MGRKAPHFAPETMGRKRKGSSFPQLAACKRRRTPAPAQESSGWASLPGDLAHLVAWRVLAAGGVVDYVAFRAVCSGWRAGTFNPRRANLSLTKPPLRPRGWVALCDGNAEAPDEAREITFFHTRTARRLRVALPELRHHRIVGFTDGLVILLNTRTTAVRVLHPFTRDAVDLPPLAPAFHQAVKYRCCMLTMSAFVCQAHGVPSSSSSSSIVVVAHFPDTPSVLWSQPGRQGWEVIHHGLELENILPFQGRLYATLSSRSSNSKRVVMVYPPDTSFMAYSLEVEPYSRFLVESGGCMLLVLQHITAQYHPKYCENFAYKIFRVDLSSRKLIPVIFLGYQALFLSDDRCLSVSAMDLPSICPNSVYFSLPLRPAVLRKLGTGASEELAESRQIHDLEERIGPSVRPFTLADHLITYCNHNEWARGLMFHEYHRIPESFEELQKKITARDSRLRIPRTGAGGVKHKLLSST